MFLDQSWENVNHSLVKDPMISIDYSFSLIVSFCRKPLILTQTTKYGINNIVEKYVQELTKLVKHYKF